MNSEILVAVVVTLVVNEATDISPWLAVRLVRWAAQRIYTVDAERAKKRTEEWEALLAKSVPTNISKLCFGVSIGAAALSCTCARHLSAALSAAIQAAEGVHGGRWQALAGPVTSGLTSLVSLAVILALFASMRLPSAIEAPLAGLAAFNGLSLVLAMVTPVLLRRGTLQRHGQIRVGVHAGEPGADLALSLHEHPAGNGSAPGEVPFPTEGDRR